MTDSSAAKTKAVVASMRMTFWAKVVVVVTMMLLAMVVVVTMTLLAMVVVVVTMTMTLLDVAVVVEPSFLDLYSRQQDSLPISVMMSLPTYTFLCSFFPSPSSTSSSRLLLSTKK